MSRLFTPTNTPALATVGGATFAGRVWRVKPPYVSPLDLTAQGTAYRVATADMEFNCRVWYGIRAATCPRFQDAVPFTYGAGTHDCTAQPPIPPQTSPEELGNDGRPGGPYPTNAGTYNWARMGTVEAETAGGLVNVFAPDTAGPHPVVFMIHGGGWGVYHALAPQQWAAQMAVLFNVVVVLPEYRLSTFGHFPHPDLVGAEPSVAYTEIKECLRWTNANIAAYGGDPAKVAIAGTSAGGAATILILEDPDTQGWFSACWTDSGGGSAPYLGPNFYIPRVTAYEQAIRLSAGVMTSLDPQYRTVQDAFNDGRSFAWVCQNALRVEHVQAMADIGPTVTAASVRAARAGTGNLVASRRNETENFFPFRRGAFGSAIEAARGGAFTKPMVVFSAECEALNLLGSNYAAIRDTLRNLPVSTLNDWAQRLGYANYDAWRNSDWIADNAGGDLGNLGSALFRVGIDPLAADCENRKVLYTHSVFGYPAWRIARAITENGGTATLGQNNFSPNATLAGHSMMVTYMFGTPEWGVGGVEDFFTDPPDPLIPNGEYANVRMDVLYVTLGIIMPKLARLAATGDPEGAYSSGPGFTIFADNPPADGGSIAGAWLPYDLALPYHQNVVGKKFDTAGYNDLNAGTFFTGTLIVDLASQRDAKTTYGLVMPDAFADYLARLEP